MIPRSRALVAWIAFAVFALMAGAVAANQITLREANLNPNGLAWEVHVDGSGMLYISDAGAGEIWKVNPSTGSYTAYQGVVNASDAQADAGGAIWWANFSAHLGKISGSQKTTWGPFPGTNSPALRGLAVGADGHIWATDFANPLIHRFDPSAVQACRYALDGGFSDYAVISGGKVWMGDNVKHRILRLDPTTNQLTWWQLVDSGAYPEGLTLDSSGNVWWADSGLSVLARLEPGLNRLTKYALPYGTSPQMVTLRNNTVWYTEDGNGSVGVLDPSAASGVIQTLTTGSLTASPTCETLGPATLTSISSTSGSLSWSSQNVTPVVSGSGWTVYDLAAEAAPWGISLSSNRLWVVDNGRQKLVQVPPPGTVPQAPVVSIDASGANVQLSWPAVTKDEEGNATTVTNYQVWRSTQPYFIPGDTSSPVPLAEPAGTSYPDNGVLDGVKPNYYYRVTAVNSSGVSKPSNRTGTHTYKLTPGSP